MKRFKKSTSITIALLIYVSATAAYFLPRNTVISDTEKYVTVAASYIIVFILWLVLRLREVKCLVAASGPGTCGTASSSRRRARCT